MNTDQRNWFAKNICKAYKQNPDLHKTIAHPEFKDKAFLTDTIKGLIRSVMGNTHNSEAVAKLLNQIQTLPPSQQAEVAQAAFDVIGTKYPTHNSLVQHSFDLVCIHGQCDSLTQVFNTWTQSYAHQNLIASYITRAPNGWRTEIERSVLQTLAANRYPQDFFRFIPQTQHCPLPETVGLYLKGFSRSPHHAMQEVERVLDDKTPDALLEFAAILLDQFSHHPNFHNWNGTVKSMHERMEIKVQHIVLTRHAQTATKAERHTRKI